MPIFAKLFRFQSVFLLSVLLFPFKAEAKKGGDKQNDFIEISITPMIYLNNINSSVKNKKLLECYLKEGDQYKVISSYDKQLGSLVDYKGSSLLSVYRKSLSGFIKIGEVEAPMNSKQIMLFVIGNNGVRSGSEAWEVKAMDISDVKLIEDYNYDVKTMVIPFIWLNELSDKYKKTPSFYIKSDRDYERLKGGNEKLGNAIRHVGNPFLSIYSKEGKDYNFIDSVGILPDSKKIILFIIGVKNIDTGRDEWKLVPVNISEAKLPKGGVFMLNATQLDIQATVWDVKTNIDAFESSFFYSPNSGPDTALLFKDLRRGKRLFSTVTRTSKERPYVIVFYSDSDRRSNYRVMVFRDINLL